MIKDNKNSTYNKMSKAIAAKTKQIKKYGDKCKKCGENIECLLDLYELNGAKNQLLCSNCYNRELFGGDLGNPYNVYLKFKKKEIHDSKYLILETKFPIPDENILVMISDFTTESGAIKHNWQQPLIGTKDIGNPKIKCLSREEFENTFDIFCYVVSSSFRTDNETQINKNDYVLKTDFLFEGKPLVVVYSNKKENYYIKEPIIVSSPDYYNNKREFW